MTGKKCKTQRFAKGGRIEGAGTGTSDSIHTEMETWILKIIPGVKKVL